MPCCCAFMMAAPDLACRAATDADVGQVAALDQHLPAPQLREKVRRGEGWVVVQRERVLGWLRFGYFWDLLPFMHLLVVRPDYRRRGIGSQLVLAWEAHLRAAGYEQVLTSTLADEQGQFFYRKLGYQDCGALLLPGEALEILLRKVL